MKFILLLITAVIFLSGTPVYADFGSFLVLKNTYLHPEDAKGRKVLTRGRKAYTVVNMEEVDNNVLQYLVIIPWKKQVITGSGFIIQSEEDLKDTEHPMVRVYDQVPDATSDLTVFKMVPAKHLQLTGRKEVSRDFPNLTWRAINYKTTIPRKFWIKEWAGLYRQDQSPEWMDKTYQESLKIKMSVTNRRKVLMGLVETGFTRQMVRLALGEPVESHTDENTGLLEWHYRDRKVIFKDNKVQQIL